MRKIFRLNKSGTSGASISPEMKLEGYNIGVLIDWVKIEDGYFGLKLVPKTELMQKPSKVEVAPIEAPKVAEEPKVEPAKEEIKADSPIL